MPGHDSSHDLTMMMVTSEKFLTGTCVSLHSFLLTNRWFSGKIIILHDDLTAESQVVLTRAFDNISLESPAADLSASLKTLTETAPSLLNRQRRFYSLEALNPKHPGSVLFCDSDVLFRGNIAAMLETSGDFIACPDRAQIAGYGRDPVTYGELDSPAKSGFRSFNAGLMYLKRGARTAETWSDALKLLAPEEWAKVASAHTDQAIYNRLFGQIVGLADPVHNFFVGHAKALENAGPWRLNDALMLHFNGPVKPWSHRLHPQAACSNPVFIRALDLWNTAYGAFLSDFHFRTRAK